MVKYSINTFQLFHQMLIIIISIWSIDASANTIKIPFRYVQSFIIIDAKLEGVLPMSFIFDTGAEQNIIIDRGYTDIFKDIYLKEIDIFGADLNQPIPALLTRALNIQITESLPVLRQCIVLKEKKINFDAIVGENIHGILTGSIFKDYIIEINYRKSFILLHKYDSRISLKKFTKHKIKITKNKPYIDCRIQMPNMEFKTLSLLLDSGAALSSILYSNADTSVMIPQNVIPSNLGSGLGGLIHGVAGRIKKFCIDSIYCIDDLVIHFQTVETDYIQNESKLKQGIIGNQILEKFLILIDYKNEYVYLKADKEFATAPKYDKSGLFITKGGTDLSKFYVSNVMPNSPAADQGIMVGDEIISLNTIPKLFLSLQKIQNILAKKPSKSIKIKLKRGKKLIKTQFTLRNLI